MSATEPLPATNPPATAAPSTTLCLLDVDLEFTGAVPASDQLLARRVLNLRETRAEAGAPIEVVEDALGLLVIAGTVWREVRVAEGCAPQLLDAGAVLLPDPPATGMLSPEVALTALAPTRLAVIDRRFTLAATRWPELMTVLHRRLAEQQRDIALLTAIAHLPRVEERVEYLLWHLAERWGRVHADGIHVELRLTHQSIGRFVGARRPTVSLALAQLRERGVVDRGPGGTWVLSGEPPSAQPARDCSPPDIV
jgi:hypothetical protein